MYVSRLDSAQSLFFTRQLEHIKKGVYQKIYADLDMKKIVPAAIDPAPYGSDTITWRTYDRVGMADLISAYADDLPNVAALASETSMKVADYGASCQWSWREIAAAAHANTNLKQILMQIVRDVLEERLDRCIAYGDSRIPGMTGFFNNPYVPTSSVATVGGDTTWADKMAAGATGMEAIYNDLMDAFDSMVTSTRGRHRPDTLVVTHAAWRVLHRPRNDQGMIDVLGMVNQGIPGLTIIPTYRAKAADSDSVLSTDMFVLYKRDPTCLSYEEPLPFTPFPPQERNLAQVVNCIATNGGTQFMFPLSAVYRTGI